MTALRGTEHIQSAGSHHFGFSAMTPGHLSLETVRRFAEGMKNLPREKFDELLLDQTGNPGFEQIREAVLTESG